MEVFIRGLPERTSEKQLTDFFLPVLSNLSIENWQCQKRRGKPFANLTFLSSNDGQTFLSRFAQAKNSAGHNYLPLGRKHLVFRGQQLSCSLSNKTADPLSLRSLEMEAKARKTKKIDPSKSSGAGGNLKCSSVSCGLWEYIGSDLVFTAHFNLELDGTVKFGSKMAIVKMDAGRRIDIPYSSMQAIAVEGLPQCAITMTLTEAPHFFRSTRMIKSDLPSNLIEMMETFGLQKGPSRTRVPGLNDEHEKIAGSCLVYRIALVRSTVDDQIKALGHARGMPPIIRHHIAVHTPNLSHGAQMRGLLTALGTTYTEIPFAVKYQVQKLAQNGFLPPKLVLALLPEIVRMLDRCKIPTCVGAIRRLFQQLPFPGFETDASEFHLDTLTSLLKDNKAVSENEDIYRDGAVGLEHMALIHRVTVTPAGIYLYGPDWESKNRILRKYPEHHDYFVRLQFSDEDGMPVRYHSNMSNDVIFQRFKKILNDGISIGGRRFAFLGFSHSSLRAQSCWFMAPFSYKGRLLLDRMLIKDLGDFSHILCPAKCAARIGQAFSDTPTAITLAPGVARKIKDVERNGRVFSDGVGTVSLSVLRQIWGALAPTNRTQPNLFQIRYSGAKGMIALDSRLQGDSMLLRPSMIKFSGSNSTDIEICGGAYRPLQFYLNQQTIKILEDMGVNDAFFLHHQRKEVRRLQLTTSSLSHASNFLKAQEIGRPIHLPWFIKQLPEIGLSFRQDNFLRDVLEIAVLVELRALKYKARIPVKNGYTLYGIMDETGILEEGQIFCTVEEDGHVRVITGEDLIITRSPALHPGDIQLVKAITVPEDSPLMHLRNCICFSQKGPRDLPSQLSGGDLDGDLYQILLDPRARPRRVFDPADYAKQEPFNLGRPVEREDMTDFFVTFMETDQLGRIATQHKVLADQRVEGVLNPDCVTLAEMHSTAVDFSKSGIPVDLRKLPRYNRYRPDFLSLGPHCAVQKDKPVSFDTQPEHNEDNDDDDDSPTHRYYESDKILGKLYRAIDEQEIFSGIQQQVGPSHADSASTNHRPVRSVLEGVWTHVRHQCQLFQWEHLLDQARGIRDEYDECVLNIAAEYSSRPSLPLSEREVFIGNVLGKTGAQSTRQRELSISMRGRFSDDLTYIVNRIVKNGTERSDESLERSIACLQVGLEKGLRGLKRGGELVSFGYVAAAVCLKEMERMLG